MRSGGNTAIRTQSLPPPIRHRANAVSSLLLSIQVIKNCVPGLPVTVNEAGAAGGPAAHVLPTPTQRPRAQATAQRSVDRESAMRGSPSNAGLSRRSTLASRSPAGRSDASAGLGDDYP